MATGDHFSNAIAIGQVAGILPEKAAHVQIFVKSAAFEAPRGPCVKGALPMVCRQLAMIGQHLAVHAQHRVQNVLSPHVTAVVCVLL